MSSIKIGNVERPLQNADADWINQQINGLRHDHRPICVMVFVNEGDINVRLQTSGCPAGGAGGRPPNDRERAILDLWTKHHLDQSSFSGGDGISFVKQASPLDFTGARTKLP